MQPSDADARRGLRDTAWGKIALLLAVLLFAVVVARSCGSRDTEVTKEEATEIARAEVAYEPRCVLTRFIPRGLRSRPTWTVSLSTGECQDPAARITFVSIDARTGDVLERSER
jgi:hypothetical protein